MTVIDLSMGVALFAGMFLSKKHMLTLGPLLIVVMVLYFCHASDHWLSWVGTLSAVLALFPASYIAMVSIWGDIKENWSNFQRVREEIKTLRAKKHDKIFRA